MPKDKTHINTSIIEVQLKNCKMTSHTGDTEYVSIPKINTSTYTVRLHDQTQISREHGACPPDIQQK